MTSSSSQKNRLLQAMSGVDTDAAIETDTEAMAIVDDAAIADDAAIETDAAIADDATAIADESSITNIRKGLINHLQINRENTAIKYGVRVKCMSQVDGAQVDGTPGDGAQVDGTPGDGAQVDGTPGDGTQGDTQGDGTQGDGTQGDSSKKKPKTLRICPKQFIRVENTEDEDIRAKIDHFRRYLSLPGGIKVTKQHADLSSSKKLKINVRGSIKHRTANAVDTNEPRNEPRNAPTNEPTNEPRNAVDAPGAVGTKRARSASWLSQLTQNTIIDADLKLMLGHTSINDRFKQIPKHFQPRADKYYQNNRMNFFNFMSDTFDEYKNQLRNTLKNKSLSCDKKTEAFNLLVHQKLIREYMNLYTPYRGLLLYHGLGSGKTCSSIAISEGMKQSKKVIIMLPASLEKNYIKELKHCGDMLYKNNQYWEFVVLHRNGLQSQGRGAPKFAHSINILEELSHDKTQLAEIRSVLANILNLTPADIKKNGGAWVVNMSIQESNHNEFSDIEKTNLDEQIEKMIKNKYTFFTYNGGTKVKSTILLLQQELKERRNTTSTELSPMSEIDVANDNPFDNCVLIIDEAHNFISQIVNKLSNKDAVSMKIYELLLRAVNIKIVMLTGTPLVNRPNELAVLYNILRGNIYTWQISLKKHSGKVNPTDTPRILDSLKQSKCTHHDYASFAAGSLTVTRNPHNFETVPHSATNAYMGVQRTVGNGHINDNDFLVNLQGCLPNDISFDLSTVPPPQAHTLFPTDLEEFNSLFFEKKKIKNSLMFQRRITGLTSHYGGAAKELLPRYVPVYEDGTGGDYEVVKIPMSQFQFSEYLKIRDSERSVGGTHKPSTNNLYEDGKSSYRVFSRMACNFIFPPDIPRPQPYKTAQSKTAQSKTDNVGGASAELETKSQDLEQDLEQKVQDNEDFTMDDIDTQITPDLERQIELLARDEAQYLSLASTDSHNLSVLSPKYEILLNNINNSVGLQLVYSQFVVAEGLKIFSLVLNANGYAEFKIKYYNSQWSIDIEPENKHKPKYVIYSGAKKGKDKEGKEILRNIFNGTLENVPLSIMRELHEYITPTSHHASRGGGKLTLRPKVRLSTVPEEDEDPVEEDPNLAEDPNLEEDGGRKSRRRPKFGGRPKIGGRPKFGGRKSRRRPKFGGRPKIGGRPKFGGADCKYNRSINQSVHDFFVWCGRH